MSQRKIKKLFIANRGEIACRIAQSARRLGIPCVTPVIEPESPPFFLRAWINEFAKLPVDASSSYLDPELMINLANEHGCDALHPGFGFLSENAAFARACQKADLTWVGPPPEAMDNMASKATARNIATNAKVPCLPALEIDDLASEATKKEVKAFAEQAGFPLLVKAALGGGGKGMRIVAEQKDLLDAAERARSEAINSFGDGTLILERYLDDPRHVEVQVLADHHGQHVVFGDRDCSVQRRHQKIVEEAPAPNLSERVRKQLHSAARSLSEAVGYQSAGTVEFLVDRSQSDQFFFLEMNTRLQVEHPVTEEVFGVDLVEWQLRVAQGEKLPSEFADRQPRGHSIEVRLYAEDCSEAQFLPSAGPIWHFSPCQGRGIRWEIGVDAIDEVSPSYDPMFAKLIATGDSRTAAATVLAKALEETAILGLTNNREFLVALLRHPEFLNFSYGTKFLEQYGSSIADSITERKESYSELAKAVGDKILNNEVTAGHTSNHSDLTTITSSVFGVGSVQRKSSEDVSVDIVKQIQSRQGLVQVGQLRTSGHQCDAGGDLPALVTIPFVRHRNGGRTECALIVNGLVFNFAKDARSLDSQSSTGDDGELIKAPVPGKVIAINVEVGKETSKDQVAFVLESMKLEFSVTSPRSGTIEQIYCKVGDQVMAGDLLASWQEEK